MPLPAIVGAIGIALSLSIPFIIAKIFVVLGLGFVTYIGMDILTSQLIDMAITTMGTISPEVSGLIGLTQIDRAINMVISSLVIRASLSFINGSFTRLVF